MAGMHDKRKPFQGKKFHKDLREFKNQEIKRSLVHRARLRKNYFKLLESEGQTTPESQKEKQSDEDNEENNDSGSESESEKEELPETSVSKIKSSGPLPPQRGPPARAQPKPQPKKVINFAERAKLAKERKEREREEKLRRVRERRQALEQKNKERERKKESLSKRTKTGQPVMGPKINDLLDKIRQNIN